MSKGSDLARFLIASGNHPVTSASLFGAACEYCQAALILAADSFTPLAAFGHVVSLSIELGLKSYLLFRDVSEEELRQIGHDLERALRECVGRGLELKFPDAWLELLNSQYDRPYISRYQRENVGTGLPLTPMLMDELLRALGVLNKAIGNPDRDRQQLDLIARKFRYFETQGRFKLYGRTGQ
jgi:hypothetical protein